MSEGGPLHLAPLGGEGPARTGLVGAGGAVGQPLGGGVGPQVTRGGVDLFGRVEVELDQTLASDFELEAVDGSTGDEAIAPYSVDPRTTVAYGSVGEGELVKNDGAKLAVQFADLLEPDEAFVAAATFTTGSIKREAWGGGSSPIIQLGLTNRRILMFSTSNLGFSIKARKFLQAIPLTEIASVKFFTGRMAAACKLIKLGITLNDGTELALEASGVTFKAAEELASALEQVVS